MSRSTAMESRRELTTTRKTTTRPPTPKSTPVKRRKVKNPVSISSTRASRSVTRSAITTGAVRDIGTPLDSRSR